jgi:hypothetical protein
VIGALLGLARDWSGLLIGLVLAFGAGALISAVSFELFEEGAAEGSLGSVALGLAAGALVYFVLARSIDRIGRGRRAEGGREDAGAALALGAFLDGMLIHRGVIEAVGEPWFEYTDRSEDLVFCAEVTLPAPSSLRRSRLRSAFGRPGQA